MYDISNKRRLGLSEKEVVMEMINGVQTLIAMEKQLENPYQTLIISAELDQ